MKERKPDIRVRDQIITNCRTVRNEFNHSCFTCDAYNLLIILQSDLLDKFGDECLETKGFVIHNSSLLRDD